MKTFIASAVITLVFAAAARAQTDGVERLAINVQGATMSSPGGEEQRVGGGANPNEPGKTARHGFSLRPDRCSFAVSRVVEPDADLGWATEITPVRVVNDAVTFRLAWARTRDEGKASTQPRSDMELTLRPGESIPLDSVHRLCPSQPRTIGASLRVTVVRYPDPDYDRRLIALDLWLVEKLEDGTERSQPLSLRGLYHRPIPFYFDSITEGAMVLDIFGEVTAASGRSHERREDHDAQSDLRSKPASRQALPAGDDRDDQNHAEGSRFRPVAAGNGFISFRLAGVVIEDSGASTSMRQLCGRHLCWRRGRTGKERYSPKHTMVEPTARAMNCCPPTAKVIGEVLMVAFSGTRHNVFPSRSSTATKYPLASP